MLCLALAFTPMVGGCFAFVSRPLGEYEICELDTNCRSL